MFRIRKMAFTGAAAVVLALAGAGLASASVVSNAYTDNNSGSSAPALAGFQVAGNGSTGYNDIRVTATIPVGSSSNWAIYLQQRSTLTNAGWTAELAAIKGGLTCPADQWALEAGTGFKTAAGPLSLGSMGNADLGGSTVCIMGGQSFYYEVYYSTQQQRVSFLAGPQEFVNVTDFDSVHTPFFIVFHSPAMGVHYTSATLPAVGTPQVSWTRAGLDQLLCSTCGAGGTHRITFDAASLTQVEAIPTYDGTGPSPAGDHPTATDPVFLQSVGFGSGSSGSVNATP